MNANSSWISVCGETDTQLAEEVRAALDSRIAAGKFTRKDVEIVREMKCKFVDGAFKVGPKDLERIRELCKLWDVQINPFHITSHRKFIGPVIVAIKKMLYPIIRVFMKDTLKQQREFNAATICAIAETLNRNQANVTNDNLK